MTKMKTDEAMDWMLTPALAEQVRAVTQRPRQFVQAAVRARLKTHGASGGDGGARATGPAKKPSAKQGKKKTK